MKNVSLNELESSIRIYLGSRSVSELRSYGRSIGVPKATEQRKDPLIESIVAVLTGKTAPIEQSKRGAPVKNSHVTPEIPQTIEELKMRYLSGSLTYDYSNIPMITAGSGETARRIAEFRKNNKEVLRLADPQAPQRSIMRPGGMQEVYLGQLLTLNNVPLLVSLHCTDNEEKIIVPVELIRQYDLREGDIVSCYAKKSHTALVASEILTVAGISMQDLKREAFDEMDVIYPSKRIHLYDAEKNNSIAMKYLHWLLPLGRGQRGCILSSPKSGKTNILYEIARSAKQLNEKITTLVLLIDQSPENVTKFRKVVSSDNLICSTYDDDVDRQVFVAEFLLQRAKRLAECGKDVLLIVDSFSALAHAFNQTNASMGGKTFQCGLESKTLQYVKKYLGAARCFEKGGSITMVGAISCRTGNPADDLIAAELASIDNWEIQLSDALAVKRIYPAIDFARSQVKQSDTLFTEEELQADYFLRNEYLPNKGEEALRTCLEAASQYEEFIASIKK